MRYHAFISYTHADESWARWLQHALERYRIPKRLVGEDGGHGRIPRRLAPVFRDREDLSAAADLSDEVQRALADSESLVIVCSPAAAASTWVNEEIRRFRALGRADRIHCLVVEGDPARGDCYPAALLEDGGHEPLAADARPVGDGKSLARLKLVAGIIGVPLDTLRQRDQQRRNRAMAMVTAGALAVTVVTSTLAFLAVQARNEAERQHRQLLEAREYMLDELGLKLRRAGLEHLMGDIGQYLAGDGDRQPRTQEELLSVAMAMRQHGNTLRTERRMDEALERLQGSREIIVTVHEDAPDDPELLFEVGHAEFWIGYAHFDSGDFDSALGYMQAYNDAAEQLVDYEPDNPKYVLELAWAKSNLFNIYESMVDTDREANARLAGDAVAMGRRARELAPAVHEYRDAMPELFADLADARLGICDLGGAYQARLAGLDFLKQILEEDPADARNRDAVARTLSGLGNIHIMSGSLERAMEDLQAARDILARLARQAPEDPQKQWQRLEKSYFVARLQGDMGQVDESWTQLQRIGRDMEEFLAATAPPNLRDQLVHARLMLTRARLASERGDVDQGRTLAEQALVRVDSIVGANPGSTQARRLRAVAVVWAWDLGLTGPADMVVDRPFSRAERLPAMPCEEAQLAMGQALMQGDRALAERYSAYLRGRGYWEPEYTDFCLRHGLCEQANASPMDGLTQQLPHQQGDAP